LWIDPYSDRRALGEQLVTKGVFEGSWLLVSYWSVFHPFAKVETGDHFIADGLSVRQLLGHLTRSSLRPRLRVTLPEGFTLFQIAERFETKGIASASAFESAARSPSLMNELGIPAGSAEGYLFPDTYELYLDSSGSGLVRRLAEEGKKRFNALLAEESAAATALEQNYRFTLHQIVTLGSLIEKEAHDPAEQPTIASVFFNRLRDDTFVPRKMLQSDPTAAYGCLLEPSKGSCKDFHGRVTPEMLRDAENPYNTYRHPGLPPGPVSNPGLSAVRAVLRPAETSFYFFVADGHGGHVFSRTLKDHQAAITSSK
jgi:UPF0755 protein